MDQSDDNNNNNNNNNDGAEAQVRVPPPPSAPPLEITPEGPSAPPLSPEGPSAPPLSPEGPSAPPLSPEGPSAPPMSIRQSKPTRSSRRRNSKVYDVVSISVDRGIDEFIRAVNTRLATRRFVPVGGVTIDKDKNVYLQALTTLAQENRTRRSVN